MKYILLIKTWSNAELKKKCKLQEYGVFSTEDGATSGTPSTPSSGDNKGDQSGTNPSGGSSSSSDSDDGGVE